MKRRIGSLMEGIIGCRQWMPMRLAHISVYTKSTMFTMVMSLMVLTGIVGNAHAAGMMLLSDNDYQQLAVNAYGGARNDATLELVNNCTPGLADCTWLITYQLIYLE